MFNKIFNHFVSVVSWLGLFFSSSRITSSILCRDGLENMDSLIMFVNMESCPFSFTHRKYLHTIMFYLYKIVFLNTVVSDGTCGPLEREAHYSGPSDYLSFHWEISCYSLAIPSPISGLGAWTACFPYTTQELEIVLPILHQLLLRNTLENRVNKILLIESEGLLLKWI